jgi:hypothetical protein
MTPQEKWLIALADPELKSKPWPGPTDVYGVNVICGLANLHSVLPVVLQNAEHLLQTEPVRLLSHAQDAPQASQVLLPYKHRLAERAAMAMFLSVESRRLIAEFAAANIDAIVLKGIDFATRLYARPGLRTFGDIDLLIRPADWENVVRTIEHLGYQSHETPLTHADGYSERSWQNPAMPGATVEMHDNLVNSPGLRRGVSVCLDDLPLEHKPDGKWLATPAGLLIIATVHAGVGHSFEKLQHLSDILLIARGKAGAIDEKVLVECAAKTGATRSLAVALDLTARTFNDPVCADLLKRLDLRWPWRARLWMTPSVVVRSQGPKRRGTTLRRQLMRQMLKTRR